jgi:glutathione S-transferase
LPTFLAAANRERDARGWCVQLLRACAAGLEPMSDERRPAELAALYGARAHAAAPASERRALLRTVHARAAKLVHAHEKLLAAICSSASPVCTPQGAASLADIMSAWSQQYGTGEASPQDAWTPWSSPWRGLERYTEEAAIY